MSIGYWFFAIGFVIALISGLLYGFGEIFWGIVVGVVLLGIVLVTRKKR